MTLFTRKTALLLAAAATFYLSGCREKDKDNVTPAPPEQWVAVSKDLIYWSDRNVLASYADDKKLLYFTPFMHYGFDTSMKKNNGSYINSPNYLNGQQQFRSGKNFRIFNNQANDGIAIADNLDESQGSITFLHEPDVFHNQPGTIESFTAPDDHNDFYVAGTYGKMGKNDTLYSMVSKYHLHRDVYIEKDLVWQVPVTPRVAQSYLTVERLNCVNGIVYVTTSEWTYRIENGVVTDKFINALKNVVSINGILYANCSYRSLGTPHVDYHSGLLKSEDNGHTWSYTGYGESFRVGRIITIDGRLFLYTDNWIALLDLQNGAVKQLNTDEVNGIIKTADLFNGRVYIGTDAGVYSKSLKNFLTFK